MQNFKPNTSLFLLLISIMLLSTSCKTENDTVYKYVNAESGLIYRDKPQGKKIGKLQFNERVSIASETGIYQTVKDDYQTIRGQWISTKIDKQEVYLFDGYLTNQINKTIDQKDSITKNVLRERILKIQDRSTADFIEEHRVLEAKMKEELQNGSGFLNMETRRAWSKINGEAIREERDTVIIKSEMELFRNLKSNRVFLIDTPILNFYDNVLTYNTELINECFAPVKSGALFLRNLKNVEFIGINGRVHLETRNNNSFIEIQDLNKAVFRNFCFYFPIEDNFKQDDEIHYSAYITGNDITFENCVFDGVGGIDIYSAEHIKFKNSSFRNNSTNVFRLNMTKGIVLDEVEIANNKGRSIFQLKEENGYGEHYDEEIEIKNAFIHHNHVKKLVGFGKSYDNRLTESDVVFNNTEIADNSFYRTFLDFSYEREKSITFKKCKIRNNKISGLDEDEKAGFVSKLYDSELLFIKTLFDANGWKITHEEYDDYFRR